MGLFSRVLASSTRNFGKTILLLLIIFILGCIISGAISVQHAVSNTDANVRAVLPSIVAVDFDWQAMNEHEAATGEWPDTAGELTPDLLADIAALPYVERYDFSVGMHLTSATLNKYTSPEYDEMMGEAMVGGWGMADHEDFTLRGKQTANSIDVEEGVIEITSGRMFEQTEMDNLTFVVIISEELAQENNLAVGSTFTLDNIAWDMREAGDMIEDDFFVEENIFATQSYEFEVVGIFSLLADINTGDEWIDVQFKNDALNQIYVPNIVSRTATLWNAQQSIEMEPDDEWLQSMELEDFIWYENVFSLYDSSDIPAFRAAVEEMAPDFVTVMDAGGNDMARIESSMQSLGNLANIILWIAVSASVLILSLLITLFLRDRKREIGIYLAIGENRSKVIVQVMTEVLVIAVIAIALSLFAGNILSANISEGMLRSDLATAQADMGMSFGGPLDRMGVSADVSTDQVLANYSVSLDAATIAIFFAITIATVIVATIVPMLYILRLNTRKIML